MTVTVLIGDPVKREEMKEKAALCLHTAPTGQKTVHTPSKCARPGDPGVFMSGSVRSVRNLISSGLFCPTSECDSRVPVQIVGVDHFGSSCDPGV